MPHPPLKPTLLLILTLLLNSCAPQTQPSLTLPIEPTLKSTLTLPTPTPAQKPQGQNPPQGQGSDASQSLDFEIPKHPYDVILGRPTANGITFSLLAYSDMTLSISYGTASGNYTSQTEPIPLKADVPQTFQLSNLQPATEYFYEVIPVPAGNSINSGIENRFHTARSSGSTFTFTIQADSHLDSNASAEVYLQTLANQCADHPDFVIDMGDTFMTDKYKPYTDAFPQYLAQRYFFGQLADTAPFFLVLGNHDGEGAPRGKNGEKMSFWSAQLRTHYFPNPVPNEFYSGNITPHATVGNLQNYYAWTWGDALFIVLDPYWFTKSAPSKDQAADLWKPTLGEEQYQWLKRTLETSNTKWKFIFIHQLIGGLEKDGRGGIEVAPYHEWGGLNQDGSYGFDEHRPGWGMPIHQLLVANHVNAVFHGHDHLFVQQELDGIIYQEIPQPGSARPNGTDSGADYGYVNGTIIGGPGHMRVTVSPERVIVDYVRSYIEEKPNQQNGQVDFSYTILP